MCRSFLYGNREVPRPASSARNACCSGPHREGEEPKPMMHDRGKSDSAIVAVKPTNNAGEPAAEPVEPRAGTKRNAGEQSTHRTQGRTRVTQALARVRKAAQQRRKEKFTALFHHLSVDLLREAFLVLKRDAGRCVGRRPDARRNGSNQLWLTSSQKDRTSASRMKFTFLSVIPTARASSASCWPRFGRKP